MNVGRFVSSIVFSLIAFRNKQFFIFSLLFLFFFRLRLLRGSWFLSNQNFGTFFRFFQRFYSFRYHFCVKGNFEFCPFAVTFFLLVYLVIRFSFFFVFFNIFVV